MKTTPPTKMTPSSPKHLKNQSPQSGTLPIRSPRGISFDLPESLSASSPPRGESFDLPEDLSAGIGAYFYPSTVGLIPFLPVSHQERDSHSDGHHLLIEQKPSPGLSADLALPFYEFFQIRVGWKSSLCCRGPQQRNAANSRQAISCKIHVSVCTYAHVICV